MRKNSPFPLNTESSKKRSIFRVAGQKFHPPKKKSAKWSTRWNASPSYTAARTWPRPPTLLKTALICTSQRNSLVSAFFVLHSLWAWFSNKALIFLFCALRFSQTSFSNKSGFPWKWFFLIYWQILKDRRLVSILKARTFRTPPRTEFSTIFSSRNGSSN